MLHLTINFLMLHLTILVACTKLVNMIVTLYHILLLQDRIGVEISVAMVTVTMNNINKINDMKVFNERKTRTK